MIDATIRFCLDNGYRHLRLLPTGEWAGVQRMAYTVGLFIGIDPYSWRTRFCYPPGAEAVTALEAWDGTGWPPGYWIKQKPEEVHGPGSGDQFAVRRANVG